MFKINVLFQMFGIRFLLQLFLMVYFKMLRGFVPGRASKYGTNGSKEAVTDVIVFLYVSLGSSTVQFHDILDSRRACACSEAGFSSQNGHRAWGLSYWRAAFCCTFLWVKDSMQRIFLKKWFLFTVGSVSRVKRIKTGPRKDTIKFWECLLSSG
jgi:hypothetical protein